LLEVDILILSSAASKHWRKISSRHGSAAKKLMEELFKSRGVEQRTPLCPALSTTPRRWMTYFACVALKTFIDEAFAAQKASH
jgi:hypothetical protein